MSSPQFLGDRAPIAVAIDTPDRETAALWSNAVSPYVQLLKIGLELFCRTGPDIVNVVRGGTGVGLFLDLKLHDIPNTVAGAASAVARLKPHYLTVHATGGAAMIRAAVDAAPDVRIAAVTVLTSLDDEAMRSVGLTGPAGEATRRLAVLAVGAGARALVCSPHEVAAIRAEVGPDITLITPGVRPVGSDIGDQARVGTPAQAIADGADLLVIGRPITGDPDPRTAAARIAASLRA
ncbi:MAG: orotidine-5-phosphate decarboxylase [Frankiaceae bacterium]|jgi:orotidine-5'-phosphate decarboxylase|nr:orotidine-5-phosphate decarboxylase [Frankiaceae bacterium]